jgi:hypothetical protein
LELTAGYESRNYLDESYDSLSFPDGPQIASNRSRRQDQRLFGGFAASMVLTRSLTLTLRYDLLLNRSIGDGDHSGPGRGFDPAARSYDRHVLLVGTTVTW